MTIDQMRALLGLGPDVPDADVVAAYAAYLAGQSGLPGAEPVSLADAKQHLRVRHSDEDGLIEAQIAAARESIENSYGLVLVRRVITETFNAFSPSLTFLSWPIETIDAVMYLDAAGVEQALSAENYRAVLMSRPARLTPASGSAWPVSMCGPAAVAVTITAGYASPSDVPASIRAAILLMVGDLYAQRETFVTGTISSAVPMSATVEALLAPYRRWLI